TLAVGIGYGYEEIARAMYEQAVELHYTAPYLGVVPVTLNLAEKLAEITPGSLSATWFSSGGSEAVESAIKLARQYHFHTGQKQRFRVISRRHAYHGTTNGALSLTGPCQTFDYLRLMGEPTLMPGVTHIPAPYCYRCDFGLEYPECKLACATALDREIKRVGPEEVSAFIAEPVMGAGGCIPPVPEYWPMVRSICDQHGILLIADEVINGFGRTGKWFACEHYDVVPDIMTLAKNISGCYAPLGATIIKAELAEKLPLFMHVHTFSGHAVSCAAGLKAIEIIEREMMVDNAADVGQYLLEGLESLREHAIVGEVRGLGMLCAVELVKNRQTRERIPAETGLADKIIDRMLDHGVFIRTSGNVIIEISPILTITRKDIDTLINALDRVLSEANNESNAWE
ncbi:MAG: aspartate aminotransferase family protein, partial [Deltaproteobacteria bacterium]|nr:aspartate aminotransferase family protein [Deltaproteobacteria bacterium]